LAGNPKRFLSIFRHKDRESCALKNPSKRLTKGRVILGEKNGLGVVDRGV
jgi:hypothetical protein